MWLSEIGILGKKKNNNLFTREKNSKLGILSFETAKTMSRLVSLYKSLSDDEILKLRNQILKSEGILHLNSKDESFLLKLACAEKIEEIDRIATTVSRLSSKCSDKNLNQFHLVYSDLKDGIIDSNRLKFGSKDIKTIVKQMEKFITATSSLHSGLQVLAEMELSEVKLLQWKNISRNYPGQKGNSYLFEQKLSWQRQQVRQLRQESLWGQTINKIVSLMAQTVCFVYARICEMLAPHVSGLVLPRALSARRKQFNSDSRHLSLLSHTPRVSPVLEEEEEENVVISTKSGPILMKSNPISTKSGPILRVSKNSANQVRFWSRELKPVRRKSVDSRIVDIKFREKKQMFCVGNVVEKVNSTKLTEQAPPSTVGGSGLALRYANVVIIMERYTRCPIDDNGRDELYEMLPDSLRRMVKCKLKKFGRRRMGIREKALMIEEWKVIVKEILGWLVPLARDTLKWQMERSFEKHNFDAKPKVLLLQTLFFADRVKTETAIGEVLVGLTCIFRYGYECSHMT